MHIKQSWNPNKNGVKGNGKIKINIEHDIVSDGERMKV